MKRYFLNLALILDQLANTLFGGDPAETISSRVGKYARDGEYLWLADLIDRIMWNPKHCQESIEDDRGGDAVIPDAPKPVDKLGNRCQNKTTMNKDQLVSLSLSILKIVGSALAAHGATKAAAIVNSEDVIGIVTILIGLIASHIWNSTPAPVQAKDSTKLGILLALLIPALLLTGCSSVYTNGCVTTVQNRFLGIQVTSSSSTTATPSILFGAGSSLVTVYPTSTNPVYCAPFFSTAQSETSANPFNVGINETIGAGNVAAAIGTNGTSASTIIPKLAKP